MTGLRLAWKSCGISNSVSQVTCVYVLDAVLNMLYLHNDNDDDLGVRSTHNKWNAKCAIVFFS